MAGVFVWAGSLFTIACRARDKIKSEPPLAGGRTDAMAAVAFSVISAEAFINELPALFTELRQCGVDNRIDALVSMTKEVREQQGSLKLKYHVSKLALTGTAYEVGKKPYQDFADLIKLHNALRHVKPDIVGKDSPKIVESLSVRKLIREPEHDLTSWLVAVSTFAVAKWACSTTSKIVVSVLDALPKDDRWSAYVDPMRSAFTEEPDTEEPNDFR